MKWSEFVVARGHAQLLHTQERRLLSAEEERLLKVTTGCVREYEARETRELKTEGAPS